ncbi:HU family DNA-binding protein [uncultured Proteiniphilum sp.]|uniref:HU family DNA-binding protein n=1 Tax=uncultured Proteiniphilum sp. TaxID=497637 RepID=UPI002610EA15|nr:HU family DNA-binding protein [uncultured Proteiniphilum sp.]
MTHDDLIAEVAKRLEWPEEKVTGLIETILEVVSTELKMNNAVVIDDFGTLKTGIQPEYILVNPKTKERHLMPPAVEVVFEALCELDENDPARYCDFTPDEGLYNDMNNSFSQFEPTLLNESVQFPDIPEIVAGEPEEESRTPEYQHPQEEESYSPGHTSPPEASPESGIPAEIEWEGFEAVAEESEPAVPPEITGPLEFAVQTKSTGRTALAGMKESPPQYRSSRRGARSNKRTSPVWIPIAGGIAIIVASLFFFKGDRDRESGDNREK